MSKISQQIAEKYTTTTAAEAVAEGRAVSKDQIWSGECYTIYVFDDNSILAQSGPVQIAVDGDDKASVQNYIAWLGEDAEHDQLRIDDMLAAFDNAD